MAAVRVRSLAAMLLVACAGREEPRASPRVEPGDCERSFSRFEGDCVRPTTPAAADGFQLHYGPTDYDDPDDLGRFLLGAGEETNDCLTMTTPNEGDVFYGRYVSRMRPGAHHLVVLCTAAESPDGELSACSEGAGVFGPGCWLFSVRGSLGGSTGDEFPPPGVPVPPENEGLGFSLGARTRLRYNMHYFNSTEEPILRESWTNVYYAAPETVTQVAEPIVFAGGIDMNVAPGTRQIIQVSCQLPPGVTKPVRVLNLAAHAHAHDKHFSVFRVDETKKRTLFYESYDWQEPLLAYFDIAHENPPLGGSVARDAAMSGILTVSPGDQIEYECDIENDLETPLLFANEVYTAEMCNLFGAYAPTFGSGWGCVAE